jgi:hypothetical protein
LTQPLGDRDPYWAPPPEPRRPGRARVIAGLAVAAVGLFGAGWFAGVTWAGRPAGEHRQLRDAQASCDPGGRGTRLTDGGRTLIVTGRGARGVPVGDLRCLLRVLDAPEAVTAQMLATRVIDGRQQDRWDSWRASWSFDPGAGLEVIIQAAR